MTNIKRKNMIYEVKYNKCIYHCKSQKQIGKLLKLHRCTINRIYNNKYKFKTPKSSKYKHIKIRRIKKDKILILTFN